MTGSENPVRSLRDYGFGSSENEKDSVPKYPMHTGSHATLRPDTFPALMDPAMNKEPHDTLYAPGANPHLGDIAPDVLAMLRSPPKLVAPPPPKPLNVTTNASWIYVPWKRELNGSKTRPEDAMHPSKHAQEDEWRPYPFNSWTSPLADVETIRVQSLPRIQYAFEDDSKYSGQRNNPSRDAELKRRQAMVKSAFVRAWQGYKTYAWGADEVRPVSEKPNNNFNGWGATIVDALDTLLMMGLHDEYRLAREHVYDVNFHYVGGQRSAYGQADGRVPVFETGIRYLGGLLSAYDLSGDALMLERAEELGQLILPAFETLSGLPVGRMHMDDSKQYTPENPRGYKASVILAEAASMLLEFTRLWQVTGNRTYFDRVQRVTDYIDRNLTDKSHMGTLIPTVIYPEGKTLAGKYTFGGQADSYYEYLIKEHQLLGGSTKQYARMYGDAINSAIVHLFKEVDVVPKAPSLAVCAESFGLGRYWAKVEHLGCFAGGMLALGSKLLTSRHDDLNIARRFTETCYWAYNSTTTGLGPENLEFYRPDDQDRYHVRSLLDGTRRRGQPSGYPYIGVRGLHNAYHNRPESIESVMYMWRTTGDPVWQERGWQMFASWMTHGLLPAGISAIRDVDDVPVSYTDSMESFTLAETLKYYYLLFSPPNVVSLDDFVFTTEAHPLLVPQRGRWAKAGDVPPSLPRYTPTTDDAWHRPRGNMTHGQQQQFYERAHQTPSLPPMRGQNPWLKGAGGAAAADAVEAVESAVRAHKAKVASTQTAPAEPQALFSVTQSLSHAPVTTSLSVVAVATTTAS